MWRSIEIVFGVCIVIVTTAMATRPWYSIYHPTEGWARGYDIRQYPTAAALGAAAAHDRERFRPDLHDCVSRFDPKSLSEMRNGGAYRLTGWFVPAARFDPGLVRACMVKKGWQPYPK
jgi:hypothetical protein